jgi:nitrite reductase/ring-hydroxylating ferredoxin subunit
MNVRVRLRPDHQEGIEQGRFVRVQLAHGSVLVGRVDCAWRAYANRCPHRLVPLDFGGLPPMSDDGRYLLCNQHGALFRREDGVCVEGPCVGDRLTELAVVGEGDAVVIAEEEEPRF